MYVHTNVHASPLNTCIVTPICPSCSCQQLLLHTTEMLYGSLSKKNSLCTSVIVGYTSLCPNAKYGEQFTLNIIN